MAGIVGAILVVAVLIGMLSNNDDPSPSPSPSPSESESGAGTDPVPPYVPTLPEPYETLGMSANVGCDSSCMETVSYDVTVNGLRTVTVPFESEFRSTVTIKNPSAYQALITDVENRSPTEYPTQIAEAKDGVPLCPALGDEPLVLEARSELICERVHKAVPGRYSSEILEVAVNYTYLLDRSETPGDPDFEEMPGYLNSNLSSVTVAIPE